jgi:hypothetical protein
MVYPYGITVCRCISTVCPSTTHHDSSTAGFRGAHRDTAAWVILQPFAQSSLGQDEADPIPEPEDENCFQGPDTESKEEAINKFLDGIEDEERSGFKDIHRLLGRLPLPAGKQTAQKALPWHQCKGLWPLLPFHIKVQNNDILFYTGPLLVDCSMYLYITLQTIFVSAGQ